MDEGRFDRQIRLFGLEGQVALERCRVGIVGLGGLGSHVAQQLVYLGIRHFALLDMDRLTSSSLNRVVGATPEDVTAGRLKVDVAYRAIRAIRRDAVISSASQSFISELGFATAQKVDFLFGCVDDDPTRFVINEFAQAYEIPYMDLATDTNPEAGGRVGFGGRIVYSVRGERCLVCTDVLDRGALDRAFSTEVQQAERDAIYGVPLADLGEPGPAVVSLNGTIASLAVTEFMVEQAGLRPAERHIEYRGLGGVFGVRPDRSPPPPDCYYCKELRGHGDAADLLRYVREGWGERIVAARG